MHTLRHLFSSYDEYHNCIIRSWLTLFSVICTFSATLFQHFKLFLSQPPTLSTLHVFVQRIFVFFLSRNSGTFSHTYFRAFLVELQPPFTSVTWWQIGNGGCCLCYVSCAAAKEKKKQTRVLASRDLFIVMKCG